MTPILISLGLCCAALIALVHANELLGESYRPTRRQRRQWKAERLKIVANENRRRW